MISKLMYKITKQTISEILIPMENIFNCGENLVKTAKVKLDNITENMTANDSLTAPENKIDEKSKIFFKVCDDIDCGRLGMVWIDSTTILITTKCPFIIKNILVARIIKNCVIGEILPTPGTKKLTKPRPACMEIICPKPTKNSIKKLTSNAVINPRTSCSTSIRTLISHLGGISTISGLFIKINKVSINEKPIMTFLGTQLFRRKKIMLKIAAIRTSMNINLVLY